MMCIVNVPEKPIRKPESTVIIRSVGIFGRMVSVLRRTIRNSAAVNVKIRDIRN